MISGLASLVKERTCSSRARKSDSCKECEAKRGRMSTKSMPGMGKSANWRRAARRLIFVRASSEAREGGAAGWGSSLAAWLSASESVLVFVGGAEGSVIVVGKEGKKEEKRSKRKRKMEEFAVETRRVE